MEVNSIIHLESKVIYFESTVINNFQILMYIINGELKGISDSTIIS